MIVARLLLTMLVQNAAVPPPPASMQGVVLDSVTGRPIAGATVQIHGTGNLEGQFTADTRDDGAFFYRNLPPGRYVIEAARGGYIPNRFGKQEDPYTAPTHELTSGQTLSGIRITLTPGAVIYGRLVDDRGDLVPGATIQAFKTTFKDGLREQTLVQTATTNDLGEYRLFMLYPGEYFVSAMEAPPSLRPFSREREVIPLYAPGTIDPKEAQVIDLHVGELHGGVDFLAFPTRTRKIVGAIQGNAGEPTGMVLSPRNGVDVVRKTVDPDTGAFQFDDVVPGSYLLVGRTPSSRAVIPLDVRNADVLNARIALGPGSRIPMHVRIEGHSPGDDPELEKLYFTINPDPAIPGLASDTYSPFANGTFAAELLDRDYRLEIARTEDYYVKTMTLNGVDVLNRGLHVTGSSDAPLEVVVAKDFGSVQGQVQGSENLTVVLVPDIARRAQRGLYKSKQVSVPAGFHFEKVPPGDYKVFVWREENGGPWLDPDYLRKYEERGTAIHIDAARLTTLNRPVQAADR